MDDKQKEKIIKLRAKGKGYKTISNILGINVNTIKSFCKRKKINAETASKLLERIPIETTFCDNCGREIKQIWYERAAVQDNVEILLHGIMQWPTV